MLVALLVCLIPTTIGALLSAIGIAGMDRLVQRNVLAMSGRAVEAAGDVSTLLLDKTGTITYGNRMASEFLPVGGVADAPPGRGGAAVVARRRDPRGSLDRGAGRGALRPEPVDMPGAELVPFTAQTRMSGIEWRGRSIRKGAADSVRRWVVDAGGMVPDDLDPIVTEHRPVGRHTLVVAEAITTGSESSDRGSSASSI